MSRKPDVRYWPSRGAFCTTIRGTQHTLARGPDDRPTGPTFFAALDTFRKILPIGAAPDRIFVRGVLTQYRHSTEADVTEGTMASRLRVLTPFTQQLGRLRLRQLTRAHIQEFVDVMRQPRQVGPRTFRWGPGSVRLFLNILHAALEWAREREMIDKNPVDGIRKPAVRSRGRDCLVSPVDHQRILALARPDFRPLIVCLENTGARPSEITAATAAAFDAEIGALVYYPDSLRKEGEHRHKTAGKGAVRTIYLTGDALGIVRDLVKLHPAGPLFRHNIRKGDYIRKVAWTSARIRTRFIRIRKRLSMPHLTAYSYRHSYATRWLEQGGSIETLAELLGNSPAILRKHYLHLCGRRPELRSAAELFTENRNTTQ